MANSSISLCRRKRVKPNKCTGVRGCKIASGTKRTFCRKIRNKNRNTTRKKR